MGVRHLTLALTALGPVHVGDGGSLSKKDYYLSKDARGSVVVVLDAKGFVAELSDNQLEKYCEFLETNSRTGLQEFLAKDEKLKAIAEKHAAYKVATKLAQRPGGGNQFFNVATFVKDAYGYPYVPGSSVKGVIRTAVLCSLINADRERYLPLYNRDLSCNAKKRQRAGEDIEREALWVEKPDRSSPDIARDIMRYVSVSDSAPLSIDDLVYVKKYDKFSKADDASHKHGMGNLVDYQGNELSVYRECLKPGAFVEFKIDINDAVDDFMPDGITLNDEGLLRIFDLQSRLYERSFLSFFDAIGCQRNEGASPPNDDQCRYIVQSGALEGMRCRNRAVGGTGYCNIHAEHAGEKEADSSGERRTYCHLGGGTDYSAKTIANALFPDDAKRAVEVSRILYARFPSEVDFDLYPELVEAIKDAGYNPRSMEAVYRYGKLKKAKNDPRHWCDCEFGVSPHTLKLGILGEKMLTMGKCEVRVGRR